MERESHDSISDRRRRLPFRRWWSYGTPTSPGQLGATTDCGLSPVPGTRYSAGYPGAGDMHTGDHSATSELISGPEGEGFDVRGSPLR